MLVDDHVHVARPAVDEVLALEELDEVAFGKRRVAAESRSARRSASTARSSPRSSAWPRR